MAHVLTAEFDPADEPDNNSFDLWLEFLTVHGASDAQLIAFYHDLIMSQQKLIHALYLQLQTLKGLQ